MTDWPRRVPCRRCLVGILSLGLLAWLAYPAPARATVMVQLPLDDLIQRADLVVRGKVLRTGTRVRARGTAAPLEPRTHVWIGVQEVLAGTAPANGVVHVWEPGGRYNDVQTLVAGSPHYERGEDVVVFLIVDKDEPGLYRTLEMTQGKYGIVSVPNGKESFAVRDMNDVSIARWRRKRMEVGPPTNEKPISVDTLSDRVRQLRLAPSNQKKVRK